MKCHQRHWFALRAVSVVLVLGGWFGVAGAAEQPVKWLVEYRGDRLPDPQVWTQQGACRAEIADGTLRVADDSAEDCCAFRAPFEVGPEQEIVQDLGQGLLMMSVAQGPDKWYEPYGVLRSTDAGRTWTPVKDLQLKRFAPQPMIRRADGSILGVSRWNLKYDDGVHVGISYRFDPSGETFTMFENRITVPKDTHAIMVFDRHIFDCGPQGILAVVYDAASHAYLLKSTDEGHTWSHFSTIGKGDEPSVARLSPTEMTALLRQGGMVPLHQVWSKDGGKTWTAPTVLEEGSVDADLAVMADGTLAASYGRPGSNLMLSADGGRTWSAHAVVSDQRGFNYTALTEVAPGRLLYLHDAPTLQALYIDVGRR